MTNVHFLLPVLALIFAVAAAIPWPNVQPHWLLVVSVILLAVTMLVA